MAQIAPAMALSQVIAHHPYLPLVVKLPSGCQPIPGVQYRTLDVDGPPTDRPAGRHADLNLALRGYEVTRAHHGLADYDEGADDPKAPQLYTLFADHRVPVFTTVYQVYDWDWSCNCRGDLLTDRDVTLVSLGVTPGEVLYLPDSGYDIGNGYEALVLYAAADRITLKYTLDDNVVIGYTIHVENVCVEPSLLALYRAWNDAGRGKLPALRGGQPFGRTRASEIRVAIRDTGTFLDPRSRWDWWLATLMCSKTADPRGLSKPLGSARFSVHRSTGAPPPSPGAPSPDAAKGRPRPTAPD
jgi:hypothetical protein